MLINHNRLDVFFKLNFLLSKDQEIVSGDYAEHISVMTNGSMNEPGSTEKRGLNAFLQEFNRIEESILENGYDDQISKIPLAKDRTIKNGSHRAAVCLKHNVKPIFVETTDSPDKYNYKYFRRNMISEESITRAVNLYLKFSEENYFVAIVWPAAFESIFSNHFPNVIYAREEKLSFDPLKNLVWYVYKDEPWIGGPIDNYGGATSKARSCYGPSEKVKLVVFQADSLSEVLRFKSKLREKANIGKSSIHITDTNAEARRIFDTLGSPSGFSLLKSMKLSHAADLVQKILKLSQDENYVERSKISITGGVIPSLLGSRPNNDIDVFVRDGFEETVPRGFEIHDSQLRYYSKSKIELLEATENSFKAFGVYFISVQNILEMKINRGEAKDNLDVTHLRSYISDDNNNRARKNIMRSIAFKVRRFAVETLRTLKLLKFVVSIRRHIRNHERTH